MFIGVGITMYKGCVQAFMHGSYEMSLEDIEYPVFIISKAN